MSKDQKTKPPEYRCSFCGKDLREVAKMISGPTVFICNECVELCAEIMAGDEGPVASGKLKALGEHTSTLATIIAERDAAVKVAGHAVAFRKALVLAGNTIADAIGAQFVRCMWCKKACDGEDEAREHVATCEQHPAVMKLRAIEAAT